jgi:L-threonylcarbamoyladenylate synthase
MTGETPVILRPGVITREDIAAATGGQASYDPVLISGSFEEIVDSPKSPGMKYTHYAPNAKMAVIEGQRAKVKTEVERLKKLNEARGTNVGVLLFEEKAFREAAHEFFAELREKDNDGVDLILAGALSDTDGVGFAVMNRMLKSAGYNIIKV